MTPKDGVMIDLRSDTVTRPTEEMRRAIAAADVGDDVFGDDPTVNRLEAMVAERLGKEASLFVTSGTQSNLCALLAHCGRGDEYIAGDSSHTFRLEAGGGAVLGGIAPQPVATETDGLPSPEAVAAAVKPRRHPLRPALDCCASRTPRTGWCSHRNVWTRRSRWRATLASACTSTVRACGMPALNWASRVRSWSPVATPSRCACRKDSGLSPDRFSAARVR